VSGGLLLTAVLSYACIMLSILSHAHTNMYGPVVLGLQTPVIRALRMTIAYVPVLAVPLPPALHSTGRVRLVGA
jgi:hypothetical protein